MATPTQDELKRAVAAKAVEYVRDGMKLGLGTGTTAEAFLDVLAPRVRGGLTVTGVPTSERTAAKARSLGIPLAELDALAPLDLTIDGADEADPDLTLIKGAGGALLREKIVAAASKQMIVITDASKVVKKLGKFTLPVEVVEYGHITTAKKIAEAVRALGYPAIPITQRVKDGVVYKTDGGNFIYDCAFGEIADAPALARALGDIVGVVEHGLFIGLATTLLVARESGVEVITRPA
ncbi:MAG TPA: ribose-5-phosphate isomerase RpiA [Rhizomicrobium sp.]|jgi:ribose 5-phosphate isomerase A|nr:ribose-5-phosphate isomerase RpiA [Rhizomicrobium sp.]